jgi:hypothetical protein
LHDFLSIVSAQVVNIMKSRTVSSLKPEDFKQLNKDGVRFEALVCQMLDAMGYRILERPGIGSDGGRDVLVERILKDDMGEKRETVLVQCKHHAHSRKAVRDSDVGVWRNAMTRYKARGYLLVTDSRVTENLSRSFREFTNDDANAANWATAWDVDQLISLLNQHTEVVDSFFDLEPTFQTPLGDLADEVRTWLQTIRYDVVYLDQSSRAARDLLATLEEGSIKQQVLVRCIDGEVSGAQVEELVSLLDRKVPQGWLISEKRISKSARMRASEDVSVKVFNLAEFLQTMIWGRYFAALADLADKEGIPNLYVDPACYKLEMNGEGRLIGKDERDSLDAYIDEWLIERGKMHISLLGEFGAGKTWFCRHYAHRQLQRFLRDPIRERLPLLITLRMFAKAMTAQQLINDALLEQYNLPFVGSAYDVFRNMNRRGKLLLILDGFDEMARQVDYQTVVDNFWELGKLADDGSKVILTSRTEYFRWAKESEKIFRGEEYGRRTIVLEPPKFEVLYIRPFDNRQIRDVVIRRLGDDKGSSAADRILGSENLAEMARKPVLVELLLTALDEVKAAELEYQAQVYLYATNKLLLRNISAEKTFTSTADKLYFLCELAWEMIGSNELRIHYTVIPERITNYFGDRIRDQHELDNWDFDLRAQTLLHRDAAGYYEFAHKSLAEYFVAFKFAAELGCLDKSYARTYCEGDGQPCKVPIEPKDVITLRETFGSMPLSDMRMQAVRGLMQGMISADDVNRLWKVVEETKGKTSEEVKYAGGNAATLLLIRGEQFARRNLAKAVLRSVNFINKDLMGIQLQGATLQETSLIGADLSHSDLTAVILDEGSLVCADLRNTKGLEPRFFHFVSEKIPRINDFHGRDAESAEIHRFLDNGRRPCVAVIVGRTGAGKSALLASVARQHIEMKGRPVCWYQDTATRVTLRRSDDFYGEIATFMTVAGHTSLAAFFARETPIKQKGLSNAFSYDEKTIQKIKSLILPAFKKEKWLICIDDITLPSEGFTNFQSGRFTDFLTFFAKKDCSTRIIVTTQSIPQELAGQVLSLQLDKPWK